MGGTSVGLWGCLEDWAVKGVEGDGVVLGGEEG